MVDAIDSQVMIVRTGSNSRCREQGDVLTGAVKLVQKEIIDTVGENLSDNGQILVQRNTIKLLSLCLFVRCSIR